MIQSHTEQTPTVSSNETGEPAAPREVAEHRIALAIVDLMGATQNLSELALSKTNEPLVRREANDIELAYVRLGRMLARIRQPGLRVVGR